MRHSGAKSRMENNRSCKSMQQLLQSASRMPRDCASVHYMILHVRIDNCVRCATGCITLHPLQCNLCRSDLGSGRNGSSSNCTKEDGSKAAFLSAHIASSVMGLLLLIALRHLPLHGLCLRLLPVSHLPLSPLPLGRAILCCLVLVHLPLHSSLRRFRGHPALTLAN